MNKTKKNMHILRFFTLFLILTFDLPKTEAQTNYQTPIDTLQYLGEYRYERISKLKTKPTEYETDTMHLQIGRQCTKYGSRNRFFTDSIIYLVDISGEISSLEARRHIRAHLTKFRDRLYKNYPQGFISDHRYIAVHKGTQYLLQEPLPDFDWKLIDKDSIVNNFSCKKATLRYAGRDYIAWYTPEIPISEGPYKFGGLPGLIVKIADTQNHHVFQLIDFGKVSYFKEITFLEKTFLKVTPKQYEKAVEQSFYKLIQRGKELFGFEYTPEQEKKKLEEKKQNDNPIELIDD